MKGAAGFTLIELSMYITLSALFSLLLFRFFNQTSTHFFKIKEHACTSSMFGAAQDLLTHDSMQANNDPAYWKQSEQGHIFLTSKDAIFWQLKNKRLYRTQGVYNFKNGIWGKKIKTLVATHVADFAISPVIKNEKVSKVHIRITSDGAPAILKEFDAYLFSRVIT